MSATELKPAAALTPVLIRRGQGIAVPAAIAPPVGGAAGATGAGREPPEIEMPRAPDAFDIAASRLEPSGVSRQERRGVSWRGAGLFGVLYLAALMLFAAAFDMLPHMLPN